MSELLKYIRSQRLQGVPDYKIVSRGKMFINEMYGGDYIFSDTDISTLTTKIKELTDADSSLNDNDLIKKIKGVLESSDKKLDDPDLDSFEKIRRALNGLDKNRPDDDIAIQMPPNTAPISQIGNNSQPVRSSSNYEELAPGTIMYHPSSEVMTFSDVMIFSGDLKKVMNKGSERKFCMFFTTNSEYAKRFNGIWSLNKRQVYIHKLRVKKTIEPPRIKIFDPRMIQPTESNQDLASQMYGITEDGMINGIKIANKTDANVNIDEYYICHPEQMFEFVETWMQMDSTRWVTFKTISTINVPENTDETGIKPDDAVGDDDQPQDSALLDN
jgi:hypothetical protein